MTLEVTTQVLTALIMHDQIYGVIGPEEIGNVYNIGMIDLSKCGCLIEKAFQAFAEGIRAGFATDAFNTRVFQTSGLVGREVFLNGNTRLRFMWVAKYTILKPPPPRVFSIR